MDCGNTVELTFIIHRLHKKNQAGCINTYAKPKEYLGI
jgi:hypothetical protein